MKKKIADVIDYEAKAEEAREKRVQTCVAEVNQVLEKHKCDVVAAVEIAGQLLPVGSVLNFPSKVQIVPK